LEGDLKKLGYNKEEEYFHKLNKALIEKAKKRELPGTGKKEEGAGKKEEKGKCPQCSAVLEVIEAFGLRTMRCRKCLGTFLTKEVLESLLEKKEPQHFLSVLLRFPEGTH